MVQATESRRESALAEQARTQIVTGYGFIFLKPESYSELEIFVPEGLARHLQFHPGATFLVQTSPNSENARKRPIPPFSLRPRTGLELETAGLKFIVGVRFRNDPGVLREFLGVARDLGVAFRSIRAFGDRGTETADYVFEGSFADRDATIETFEEIAGRCSKPVVIIYVQELAFHDKEIVGYVSSNLYQFVAPLVGGRFLKFCVERSPGFQFSGHWDQKIVRMVADFAAGNLRVDTSLMNEVSYLISVECSDLTNTAPITYTILDTLPREVNVEAINGMEFVRLVPEGSPAEGGIAGRAAKLDFLCTSPVSLKEYEKKIERSVNDALREHQESATVRLEIKSLGDLVTPRIDHEIVASQQILEHRAFRRLLDDGRFFFLGELGKGRFGVVNEYLDLHSGKRVAGKIFQEPGGVRREEIEALKRATKAGKQLNQNLVTLEKIFYEGLAPVLIMEKLHFCLKDHQDNPESATGNGNRKHHSHPGNLDEFIDMALQLLTGLDDLHHLRSIVTGETSATVPLGQNPLKPTYVHRDIAPYNIGGIVSDHGKISWKLMDFGLVAALPRNSAPESPRSSEGIQAAGSLPYMSPQAFMGEVGPANDVFSLGIVFFQVLCGWVHPSRSPRGGRIGRDQVPLEVAAKFNEPGSVQAFDDRNWILSKKYSNSLRPDAERELREIIYRMISLDPGKVDNEPPVIKASLHRWRNELLRNPPL